jgi:hypothetical protein
MSICRTGEDSDLYVYKSVNGDWVIHVATCKIIVSEEEYNKTMKEITGCGDYELVSRELERMHGPIGLGHDGETFNCPNIDVLEEKVKYLKEKGYLVPDDIWDKIKERRSRGQ